MYLLINKINLIRGDNQGLFKKAELHICLQWCFKGWDYLVCIWRSLILSVLMVMVVVLIKSSFCFIFCLWSGYQLFILVVFHIYLYIGIYIAYFLFRLYLLCITTLIYLLAYCNSFLSIAFIPPKYAPPVLYPFNRRCGNDWSFTMCQSQPLYCQLWPSWLGF